MVETIQKAMETEVTASSYNNGCYIASYGC